MLEDGRGRSPWMRRRSWSRALVGECSHRHSRWWLGVGCWPRGRDRQEQFHCPGGDTVLRPPQRGRGAGLRSGSKTSAWWLFFNDFRKVTIVCESFGQRISGSTAIAWKGKTIVPASGSGTRRPASCFLCTRDANDARVVYHPLAQLFVQAYCLRSLVTDQQRALAWPSRTVNPPVRHRVDCPEWV